MIRRPPRSTRTDTLFPTRRSSDLLLHRRERQQLPHNRRVRRIDPQRPLDAPRVILLRPRRAELPGLERRFLVGFQRHRPVLPVAHHSKRLIERRVIQLHAAQLDDAGGGAGGVAWVVGHLYKTKEVEPFASTAKKNGAKTRVTATT